MLDDEQEAEMNSGRSELCVLLMKCIAWSVGTSTVRRVVI
jgi:hypothetical protein